MAKSKSHSFRKKKQGKEKEGSLAKAARGTGRYGRLVDGPGRRPKSERGALAQDPGQRLRGPLLRWAARGQKKKKERASGRESGLGCGLWGALVPETPANTCIVPLHPSHLRW
ncbi:hypothetical protein IF1G_03339 [Cordyceps javanica]|uniref:Uncharacterized protein n=1 Tax=Cordyceps javanica TaxID=43265 RepID=A0A545V797_9HYPO|nr:hypothetical protein IF1G_03339 [Cordyceps javanica]